jgi:SNF2 family DNA or RNA helicase
MPLSSSALPDPYAYLRAEYNDPTKTKEELEELLKQIRPDEEVVPDQIAEQPEGLKVTLMPHQIYGLTWMKKMEDGANKGGILADDMGLGKTIQSIALMLSRPSPEQQHRPTLVVAPVALMQQWKREIEKMVRSRHRLNVFVLHGETRKTTWATLRAYDVVLTTYGLLTSELKRKLAWEDHLKLVPDARPSLAEECPVLGERSHFQRVILDEAQNIKNRSAKSALAACRIHSDYRWALTGTPMQNNVEEMFSLIKFCRIRPYSDWQRFSQDISRPLKARYPDGKDKAMTTLQALLRAILLRRTKQSKINGQPILQLPAKNTTEARVTFNEDETNFYKALERSSQIQINRYISKGSIGQNYSHALVLLLRLRQACCHPHLVTQSKDFIQTAGNLDTNNLIANAAQLDPKVVNRLKDVDSFECPVCMDAEENPALFPCGHALCSDCLSKLIDQAATDDNNTRPTCPHCRAPIDANKITDKTSFLRVHFPDREGVEPLGDDDGGDETLSESDSDEDDSDSDEGEDLNGFVVPDDFEEGDVEPEQKKSVAKKDPKKKKRKGRRSGDQLKSRDAFKTLAQLRKEGLKNKAAKRKYLKRLRKNFIPSAKIERTIELLEEIKSRGENEKTIIFSNFTSFLDLLEVPLTGHQDFRDYVRYDGSMSPAERNDAVMEFTDNPRCNVILVSLKAGNSGLNLTVANHVVMLDPFWNPFVEYQAADRCYRIGQLREVTVHRVLIGGGENAGPVDPDSDGFTVEDRILALQERKRELVETALDDSAGRSVARLGVRELGYLFGLNRL